MQANLERHESVYEVVHLTMMVVYCLASGYDGCCCIIHKERQIHTYIHSPQLVGPTRCGRRNAQPIGISIISVLVQYHRAYD